MYYFVKQNYDFYKILSPKDFLNKIDSKLFYKRHESEKYIFFKIFYEIYLKNK